MNRSQLKKQHQLLNEKEPFTEKENIQYNKKDKSMIRNIQILNNINKKDALKVIRAYKSTPKQTLRRLAKTYRERLEKYSAPQKPDSRGIIKPPHKKKLESREVSTFAKNRNDVVSYINNPKKKNQAGYSRVVKGHKKYIDASEPELKHGVNSKWSQKYRVKTGLSKKYTGRVIK